ncbi:MAG: glycosyltransferase family 4 protein [Deltaproteobacteria bacterium]|nr:glycosyltransferase family 4 protein [Deltaproteobacteria bacterium]
MMRPRTIPSAGTGGRCLVQHSGNDEPARIAIGTLTNVGASLLGISGCAVNILRNLERSRFTGRLWASHGYDDVRGLPEVVLTIPPLVFRAACKLRLPLELVARWNEREFLRQLDPSALVWAFPGWSPALFARLRARGHTIILERINSAVAHARQVLAQQAARHGLPVPAHLNQQAVDNEAQELESADYIFVCSPFVERSFRSLGVPERKLVRCSYGWSPADYQFPPAREHGNAVPRFLFVGADTLRKGLPDLLTIWQRANPPAVLRILGRIAPEISARFSSVLSQSNVEVLGTDYSLTRHYRESDVFVLPSHEEGSPLVTYIALGAGIPSLVSPAGAGGIVRDDVEGLVRDPTDADAFTDALLRLATDADLRERLGRSARAASTHYTWQQVAASRSVVFAGIAGANFDATTVPWPADER